MSIHNTNSGTGDSPFVPNQTPPKNYEVSAGRQRVKNSDRCPVCNQIKTISQCDVFSQRVECTAPRHPDPLIKGERWTFQGTDMIGRSSYIAPGYIAAMTTLAHDLHQTRKQRSVVRSEAEAQALLNRDPETWAATVDLNQNSDLGNNDLETLRLQQRLESTNELLGFIQVYLPHAFGSSLQVGIASANPDERVGKNQDINRRQPGDDPLLPKSASGIVAQQLYANYGYIPPGHDLEVTQAEVKQFVDSIHERPTFHPRLFLPDKIATAIEQDAKLLCIDPVLIWQYLLPSVLSLMGHTRLRIEGKSFAPNIAWTMAIAESGDGKSRAVGLVTRKLLDWQYQAQQDYEEAMQDYQTELVEAKKAKAADFTELPEAPTCTKYVFGIATIQAVCKRLAENDGNGCLWLRDELAGLFNSFAQFNRGPNEGLEILLETWDGNPTTIDRVDLGGSFCIAESRLSVAGGIQPGKIREVFNLGDAQGVLARFLPAIPNTPPREWLLGDQSYYAPPLFSDLYNNTRRSDWSCLDLEVDALPRWKEIYDTHTNEIHQNSGVRAWVRKYPSHCARIAIALHAIECWLNPAKPRHTVSLETLEKAYGICRYYFQCVERIHSSTQVEGISGCLKRIYEFSCSQYASLKEPVSLTYIYRSIHSLRKEAKQEGLSIAKFTLKLCQELEIQGYGKLDIGHGNKKVFIPELAHYNPTAN